MSICDMSSVGECGAARSVAPLGPHARVRPPAAACCGMLNDDAPCRSEPLDGCTEADAAARSIGNLCMTEELRHRGSRTSLAPRLRNSRWRMEHAHAPWLAASLQLHCVLVLSMSN